MKKNVITQLNKKTSRKFIERMINDKVNCIKTAKKYDFDFWDGDRKYGYGSYKYDGRYEIVAKKLIEEYNLKKDAKILDVGCGKFSKDEREWIFNEFKYSGYYEFIYFE